MGLASEAVEAKGIPTVTLAMERGVRAPRAAFVPFAYNHPLGDPGDTELHREVALRALALLRDMRGPGEAELF